ncbi:hypothetical protein OWM07_11040 [Deferribacter thermophilus]|uniref:CsgG/HfaB family protein n=1 Tax=Deferribacter thermophilus TaxID=53573 RepID=UPI003C2727A8
MKFVIFYIFLFISIISCTSPQIKVNVTLKPKYYNLLSLKSIAVLPFEGKDGKIFSNKIESMISDTLLQNGNEYYKLVERSEINKIIEELKFSNSGLVNKKDVINFGKLIGASAILTGTINISKVEDTMFKEQRSECIKSKKSKLKTPLGNIPVSKCLKWRYYDVNCQKRTATFSATTKIIEVETETIIYSSDYTETAKSAACPDSGYPVKSSAELLTIAQNKVLEDIRRDILPYKVILTIELKDNDDDIKDKNAKKYFRAGLEFTSNNRIKGVAQ